MRTKTARRTEESLRAREEQVESGPGHTSAYIQLLTCIWPSRPALFQSLSDSSLSRPFRPAGFPRGSVTSQGRVAQQEEVTRLREVRSSPEVFFFPLYTPALRRSGAQYTAGDVQDMVYPGWCTGWTTRARYTHPGYTSWVHQMLLLDHPRDTPNTARRASGTPLIPPGESLGHLNSSSGDTSGSLDSSSGTPPEAWIPPSGHPFHCWPSPGPGQKTEEARPQK